MGLPFFLGSLDKAISVKNERPKSLDDVNEMASHVKIVQSNYKGVSDLGTFMDYSALPGKSCESLNYILPKIFYAN